MFGRNSKITWTVNAKKIIIQSNNGSLSIQIPKKKMFEERYKTFWSKVKKVVQKCYRTFIKIFLTCSSSSGFSVSVCSCFNDLICIHRSNHVLFWHLHQKFFFFWDYFNLDACFLVSVGHCSVFLNISYS